MKIIAIGMNYVAHCHELHANENLPKEPVIFMKPDSALLKDSKPFFIPDFSKQIDYETELVVRICRLGKNIAPRFAHRYYDAVTVGIVIGPEGGFAPEEAAKMTAAGISATSLGRRILRTESAAPFVLACLSYAFED